jgi:hypothetical protein
MFTNPISVTSLQLPNKFYSPKHESNEITDPTKTNSTPRTRLCYKVYMFLVYCCLASAIWAAVPLVRSGSTGRPGWSKGTPGETRLYVRTLLTNPRCPRLPPPRMGLLCILFKFCETCVGRITVDLRQRGTLEIVLPVVELGARHCLCSITFGIQADNSGSSVTRGETVVTKMSFLLELWFYVGSCVRFALVSYNGYVCAVMSAYSGSTCDVGTNTHRCQPHKSSISFWLLGSLH